MGIFDRYRIRKEQRIEEEKRNEKIQERKKKYEDLINNPYFVKMLEKKLNLNMNYGEDLLKIPETFLDKCLNNNSFSNFLLEHSYKIDPIIFRKIVDNNITFDDISYEKIFLLELLPETPRIKTLLNREILKEDKVGNYAPIVVNDELKAKAYDYPIYVKSYIPDVELLIDNVQYAKCVSLFDIGNIKVINKIGRNICAKGFIIKDDNIINDDSIILLNFEKYKKLSKDSEMFKILQTHKFFISDNPEEKFALYDLDCTHHYYNQLDYEEIDIIKYNHVINIIKQCSLPEQEKKYWLYKVSNEYNIFSFGKLVKSMLEKIDIEEIKEITEKFNNLNKEEKTKDNIEYPYSIEMFYYFNPDFDEKDINEKINILSCLESKEFKFVIKDDKIKKFFDEEINDYSDLIKFQNLLSRIDKISNNKCVNDFIKKQGLDIKNILETDEYDMTSENKIDELLSRYYISDQICSEEISIQDIVGLQKSFIRGGSYNLIENFSSFFKSDSDGYHTRAISMLDFKDGQDAMNNLLNSFKREPIRIDEYDGKYVISENGCHRYMVLRFFYTKDLLEGKLSEEELKQKYMIPNCLVKKANYEKTYLNYLIKNLDISVKQVFNDKENGLTIMQNKEAINITVEQLKEKVKELLNDLRKEHNLNKLLNFKNDYNTYPLLKKYIDNNLSEYIDIFTESEEINFEKRL